MHIVEKVIQCKSRSARAEIFPLFDIHLGKYNCAEDALRKQVKEILHREKKPDRHPYVIFGGDQVNAINPGDLRRFDFAELADWFFQPRMEANETTADFIRRMLSDICAQEVDRFVDLFKPIQHLVIGALYGNHEKSMRTRQNVNVHDALCSKLNITNLTDEALIRLRFRRTGGSAQAVVLYLRHGYGAGRTPGAEPNKLARMLAEWECADVCISGHSHSYCILPPKAVPYIQRHGRLDPRQLVYRYRFAANPGCWLYSHLPGPGSYESSACYPAKPMMTLKIVIWPFWSMTRNNKRIEHPKIELREYPIL